MNHFLSGFIVHNISANNISKITQIFPIKNKQGWFETMLYVNNLFKNARTVPFNLLSTFFNGR